MRSLVYLALAALLGGLWHTALYLVLLALAGVGLRPPPLPLAEGIVDWSPLPISTSVLTSLLTAVLLRRRIARGRLMPVSLGFWALGGALWPLIWMALATAGDVLGKGWEGALADGEVLFLALTAPYLGFAVSALLVWIVWPLAAGEVWLLSRVLVPAVGTDEGDQPASRSEPAPG